MIKRGLIFFVGMGLLLGLVGCRPQQAKRLQYFLTQYCWGPSETCTYARQEYQTMRRDE